MNKILKYMLLPTLLALMMQAQAQSYFPNPEPSTDHVFFVDADGYAAHLDDETFYKCSSFVPTPLSPSDAMNLLNIYGHLVSHDDCGTVAITTYIDQISDDDCKTEYWEEFWAENDCVYEILTRRKIIVYKTPDMDNSSYVTYTKEYYSPTCSLADPETSVGDLAAYVGGFAPNCWMTPPSGNEYSISYNTYSDEIIGCIKHSERTYVITSPCGYKYYVTEPVTFDMTTNGPIEVSTTTMNDLYYWGCSDEEVPEGITSIDDLNFYGVDIIDEDCTSTIMVSYTDGAASTHDGKVEIQREYTLEDDCHGQTTTLKQKIIMQAYLWTDGRLDTQSIPDDGELPEPSTYLNIGYLKDHGIRITYPCEEEDLEVVFVKDEEHKRGEEMIWIDRFYSLRSITRDYVTPVEIRERYIKPFNPNVEEFTIKYTDCSDDVSNDGSYEITPPPDDPGCYNCDYNDSYRVHIKYTDKDYNVKEMVYPDKDHPDPFYVDDLAGGWYELKLYARCPGLTEGDDGELIAENDFEIFQAESEVKITPWMSFYASSIYCEMFADHYLIKDFDDKSATVENGYYAYWHAGKKKNVKIRSIIHDGWESMWKYDWSSDIGEFVRYCYEKPGPWTINWNIDANIAGGWEFMKSITMLKIDYRKTHKARANVTFSAHADVEDQTLVKQYTRPAYWGFFNDSYDPNMIAGPAGYGEDSIISTEDRIDYRISFENSPDFATAAASRVTIRCPLHEKAEPKSVRLGQFGFGDFIYEVPELSSHYNNRIDLADTLGVWLDVTAGLDIDKNEMYWIFQSIDPETGVQPNDTIGFLPVNDTTTGCGEGFVAFSVTTFDDTKTGDTITELAKIVFDENDTVPTNTCTNMFDAVAPTSTLYCDTTGVASSYYLTFKAVANDDEGGSGVGKVELFANGDKTSYLSAGQMVKDSVSDTLRLSFRVGYYSVYDFVCIATDNTGNEEAFKTEPEVTFINNNPPTDIFLSNRYFKEDAKIGDKVGTITTADDQDSDEFEYKLVEGEGDDDNSKFMIVDDRLNVNSDFRCKENDVYKVRIQSKDVNGDSIQKWFYLYAKDVLTPDVTDIYEKLCFGETVSFDDKEISAEGIYYDTLQTVLGCDSVLKLTIVNYPDPVITYFNEPNCDGADFWFKGALIPRDSTDLLTPRDSVEMDIPWDSIENNFISSWDRSSDTILIFKVPVENVDGCYDTAWLNMLLHPKRYDSHDVTVCQNGLPFRYGDSLFSEAGTKQVHFTSFEGCDSIVTINLTVQPSYDNVEVFDTICDNEQYVIFGDTITTAGRHFVDGKTNIHYCDSVVCLNLVVLPTASKIFDLNVCSSHLPMDYEGFSIPADTTSCTMYRYETAKTGCDSIVTLNLTVRNADTQITDFEGGWYWYSTYLDLNEIDALQALEDSLGEKGSQIKSHSEGFDTYTPGFGWMGNLEEIENERMYMIQTTDTVAVDLFSCLTTGSEHPITIKKGWNWIGYVSQYSNSTVNALGSITPAEGDIIKSYDHGFAAYYDVLGGWFGSLTQMQPGVGYMYYSNNENDITLTYPEPAKDEGEQLKLLPTHWNTIAGKYPNNMTFIGKITIDNIPTTTDNLEVGVFCNGEVRGSGRAILMEGLGTYRLFVQVYGENGDNLTFKLYDHKLGREHDAKSYQKLQFADNANYGSIHDPYPFKFYTGYVNPDNDDVQSGAVTDGDDMNEEGMSHELTLVPNPANSNTRVLLYCDFTPEERDGLIVEVFNDLGVKIQQIEPTRYPVQLNEIKHAGNYLVRVTTGTGRTMSKKLVITR